MVIPLYIIRNYGHSTSALLQKSTHTFLSFYPFIHRPRVRFANLPRPIKGWEFDTLDTLKKGTK